MLILRQITDLPQNIPDPTRQSGSEQLAEPLRVKVEGHKVGKILAVGCLAFSGT